MLEMQLPSAEITYIRYSYVKFKSSNHITYDKHKLSGNLNSDQVVFRFMQELILHWNDW